MRYTELRPADLVRAVGGDMHSFALVQGQSHSALRSCRLRIQRLVVTAAMVHDVIEALERDSITPEQAQGWASFIRHGYVESPCDREPIMPIDIDYDAADEDRIAAAIARLDEIGDQIDGEIDHAEMRGMIVRLS